MTTVLEQDPSAPREALLEMYFLFRERMESLQVWRDVYGGDSALREAERLYAMRRSGDKRLARFLIVPALHSTAWYWKRSGEGRQTVYATVCPWCLPGPPGSGPYVDGRFMGYQHAQDCQGCVRHHVRD